jgi:hypothetical protein
MAPQSEDVPAKFRLWVVAKTFQHLLYCWLYENINKSPVKKKANSGILFLLLVAAYRGTPL